MSTYRRWVLATTLGELVGFSIPAGVWGLTALAGLDERVSLAPIALAGAGEGAVLGYAQTRALRADLPELKVAGWVKVTAAAGAVSWAIGMIPSTFHDAFAELPAPALVVLGCAGAAILLGSIGTAQATMLRRHVEHATRWIGANALGWLAGLPVAFIAFAIAPEHPAALRAVFAIVGGVGMGAVFGAVTGGFLVRLLRRPRARPPQSLRHRARVHLNHVHAWVYERSGGRLGGRMAGHPVLLLTTVGRRTGRHRRTPVQYERVGDDLLVVASAGGTPKPPDWLRNIEATAEVTVQIGRTKHPAYALIAGPAERAKVWPELCRRNRYLEPLQRKAGRELQVVQLVSRPALPIDLRTTVRPRVPTGRGAPR